MGRGQGVQSCRDGLSADNVVCHLRTKRWARARSECTSASAPANVETQVRAARSLFGAGRLHFFLFFPRAFFRRIRRPKRLLAGSPTIYGRLTVEGADGAPGAQRGRAPSVEAVRQPALGGGGCLVHSPTFVFSREIGQ